MGPPLWDQYLTAHSKDHHLNDEVHRIAQTCALMHRKVHVVDCPKCYGESLDQVKARYTGSAGVEWFAGRRPFTQELNALVSDAKIYKIETPDIVKRVELERYRWYVERVKAMLSRFDEDVSGNDLKRKLGVQDVPVKDIAEEVQRLVRSKEATTTMPSVEAFLAKLASATTDQDRIQLYVETFFEDVRADDPVAAKHRQKYVEMLKTGLSMERVAERIRLDAKSDANSVRIRKGDLLKRLDELRRGRAAHEVQKQRKARGRAGGADEARQPPVADELYELPACFTCEKNVDYRNFVQCVYCRLLSGWGIMPPTVYCNVECHDQGFSSHEKAHQCASGLHCIQPDDGEPDGDVDMDGGMNIVMCAECVRRLRTPAMFCSRDCLAKNFQRHREDIHVPAWARLGLDVKDANELEYENSAKTKYHAKNIDDWVVTIDSAVKEWEMNHHTSF